MQIKYPPSYSSFSSSLITHCFFQWLKRYLLQGYAINQKRLFEAKEKFNELQETISFLQEKSKHELLSGQEQEILNLLANYSKTLTLLEQYDLVPSCLFIFLIKIITYTLMNQNLDILITEESIRKRVKELGEKISSDYAGREIIAIGILKGARVFVSDLVREIEIPVICDFIGVSSYGD